MIDCQFHWHPPELCEHDLGRSGHPRATRIAGGYRYELSPVETQEFTARFIDLDAQLAHAAEASVDAVVSSPSAAGDVGARADLGEAKELAAMLNEAGARAQEQHTGRFHGLAVLPMQDVAAAIETLEHAIGGLGLRGVCVFSNVAGASIASRELWPLWERVEQMGAPAFLHPTGCFRDERVAAFDMERPLGYMFDTSLAVLALIVSGVLDAYPGLRIVHPHLGGTLPFLAGRLEVYRRRGLWPGVEQPIDAYLRRLHFDTVSASPAALAMAIETVGIDRLLLATDYPYWSLAEGVAFVMDNVPAEHLAGVCHGHAEALLGLDDATSGTAVDTLTSAP